MIKRVGFDPPSLESKHDRQVIPMYLKQLAAFGMSAVMVLSGGVMASGAETKTTVDTVTPQEYTTAVEKLAANGVVSGSTTALQAGDGLRLAQESGLLDGEDSLSLTELAAQALIRETEALQNRTSSTSTTAF